MALGSAGSLRSPTCIPSDAVPASYHKVGLQRRSDGLSSKLSHPFGSKMRPDAHTGQLLETRPLFPVLTCTPSGTGFTMLLLWDPGRHPGNHCQAPSSVSCPRRPAQAPTPRLRKYRESHSQAGPESGRITLINVDIIFQAPCQGSTGTATVMEAAWNPSQTVGS